VTPKKNNVIPFVSDIIEAIKAGSLPNKVMFTMHPQRWHKGGLPWVKELVGQRVKNVVKRWFFVSKE